jgi:hypothetical protein
VRGRAPSWDGTEWLKEVFTTFILSERVPEVVRFDQRAPKWKEAFTLLCTIEHRERMRAFTAASSLVDWKK